MERPGSSFKTTNNKFLHIFDLCPDPGRFWPDTTKKEEEFEAFAKMSIFIHEGNPEINHLSW